MYLAVINDIPMKNPEWNSLRAKLHHDWLQNRYLTFLMARVEYMDNALAENKPVRADIIEQFTDWKTKINDIEKLIDETVEALSPAQLIDEYPLNRMAEDNKAWLGEVVHALYIERTGIKAMIRELGEKLDSISELFSLLARILKGENSELRDKAREHPFQRFHKKIQEFSKLISALPHEVKVI